MSEQLLTCAEAAERLDMSESGVYKLITRRILTRRHNARGDRDRGGIVSRAEVEQVALVRAKRAAELELERAQREAARQAAATGSKVATADGGWAWVPPDEVHDWISVAEAAAITGVTPQAITNRCRTGTIPATKLGQKWWIQAEHARIAANVRATSGPEDIVTTRPPDTA